MSSDFITVRVGALPGRIQEVVLNGGRTAQDAIDAAGLDPDGYQIQVGRTFVSADHRLNDGDTVLLVESQKGA